MSWTIASSGSLSRRAPVFVRNQVVADEIIRLRRHSDALARLLRELAPIQVQPTDTGDSEVAALLTGMLNHILASPEELDLIARAILEAPGEGPGPTVDG